MSTIITRYHYSQREIDHLLSTLVVLVDTREQVNSHIKEDLALQGISWKKKALTFGDYAFFLPRDDDMGIERDLYFHREIVIERKGSLEELSSNLTKGRSRFESELIKASGAGCRLFLLVEGGSWERVISGDYKTQYNPRSYMASLLSYSHRYNMHIVFLFFDPLSSDGYNTPLYRLGTLPLLLLFSLLSSLSMTSISRWLISSPPTLDTL